MIYELRKIAGNIPICIMFSAFVIINALMFFAYCTDDSNGYTMTQIQSKYRDIEGVKKQQEIMENSLRIEGRPDFEGVLLTGDIYSEIQLNNEVLDRTAQAEGYEEYRAEQIAEARLKLKLGIVGEAGSFEACSLERGADEYEALAGVVPVVSFFGGAELFANRHSGDIFLLFFCLTAPFILFTYEKGSGLKMLSFTAKNGRAIHYLRKFGASFIIMSAGFVLLYSSNIIISIWLFGLPDMSAPVQSVYGFAGCPMRISVGQFYLLLLIFKYLWAVACLSLAVLICALSGSGVKSAAAAAVVAGVSVLFSNNSILWLRNISLSSLIYIENLFKGAVYLNFFGSPVRRLPAATVFLITVIFGSFLGGMTAYCKISGTVNVKTRSVPKIFVPKHTNLFCHELGKAFFVHKGVVILLAFLAVQAVTYKNYEIINTEYEVYYRHYSEILEGEPNKEKDKFIAEEKARFIGLSGQLSGYGDSPDGSVNGIPAEIYDSLKPQEAFEDACEQYENLKEGQSYLYRTPYTKLYGPENTHENLLNFAKMFLVLALLLSSVFAYESETGVRILQITAGKIKAVSFIKVLIIMFYALVCAVIAFLPKYAAVSLGYGGIEISARANSVMWFEHMPDIWSVGGVLAATFIILEASAILASAVISLISLKTKNSVITLVISLALFQIPVAIMLFIL